MRTTLRRAALGAATTLVTATGLAACGNDAARSGGASSGDDVNAADVAFASEMIPHHAQALEMARMVDGEDVDPEVATLAERIEAAQRPEIDQLTSWLEAWGEPVPDASTGGVEHRGMDMGAMDMPGMMSSEDMTALGAADGRGFQRMWLEMMIEHHRGAIEMARAQQDDGAYPPAVDLAGDIESAQANEIDQMQSLLRP